ncbi:hypothetical protein L3V79_05445 [Thiotrichales bacterium 19S9-12]|nr:hypothetical protein [Thiotrichales bacterium 19S9-11]MCF6811803.1 hypothetical protein [Thiotrichales bacterium 19S9-12]
MKNNHKKETFRSRWGVESNWQVLLIFIVFSITGSLAVALAHPVVHFFGLNQETTNPWIFWPIRIAIIFPIYQVLLFMIGTLVGQKKFFWHYGRKMLKRMGLERLCNLLLYKQVSKQ